MYGFLSAVSVQEMIYPEGEDETSGVSTEEELVADALLRLQMPQVDEQIPEIDQIDLEYRLKALAITGELLKKQDLLLPQICEALDISKSLLNQSYQNTIMCGS